MKSFIALAVLLACAGTAMAQDVNTTGLSASVSGNEITTTKSAGTNNVTTYVTEGPRGTTYTKVYNGSGGTKYDTTFVPRRK
jgi:hypothetical protein